MNHPDIDYDESVTGEMEEGELSDDDGLSLAMPSTSASTHEDKGPAAYGEGAAELKEFKRDHDPLRSKKRTRDDDVTKPSKPNDVESFLKKKKQELAEKVKNQLRLSGIEARVESSSDSDSECIKPDVVEKAKKPKGAKVDKGISKYYDLDRVNDPVETMLNNWTKGKQQAIEASRSKNFLGSSFDVVPSDSSLSPGQTNGPDVRDAYDEYYRPSISSNIISRSPPVADSFSQENADHDYRKPYNARAKSFDHLPESSTGDQDYRFNASGFDVDYRRKQRRIAETDHLEHSGTPSPPKSSRIEENSGLSPQPIDEDFTRNPSSPLPSGPSLSKASRRRDFGDDDDLDHHRQRVPTLAAAVPDHSDDHGDELGLPIAFGKKSRRRDFDEEHDVAAGEVTSSNEFGDIDERGSMSSHRRSSSRRGGRRGCGGSFGRRGGDSDFEDDDTRPRRSFRSEFGSRGRRDRSPFRRRGDRDHFPPLCKFYMDGYCREGDSCRFSHDAEQPPPRGAGRLKELCKFYRSGYCRNGRSCPFMHGDFPCKDYHKCGSCTEGDKCRYSHNQLDEVTKPLFERLMKEDEGAFLPTKRKVLLGEPPAGISTPQSRSQQYEPHYERDHYQDGQLPPSSQFQSNDRHSPPNSSSRQHSEWSSGGHRHDDPYPFKAQNDAPHRFNEHQRPMLPEPSSLKDPPPEDRDERRFDSSSPNYTKESTCASGGTRNVDIANMLRQIKADVKGQDTVDESPASPEPSAQIDAMAASIPLRQTVVRLVEYRLVPFTLPPRPDPTLVQRLAHLAMSGEAGSKFSNDPRIKHYLGNQIVPKPTHHARVDPRLKPQQQQHLSTSSEQPGAQNQTQVMQQTNNFPAQPHLLPPPHLVTPPLMGAPSSRPDQAPYAQSYPAMIPAHFPATSQVQMPMTGPTFYPNSQQVPPVNWNAPSNPPVPPHWPGNGRPPPGSFSAVHQQPGMAPPHNPGTHYYGNSGSQDMSHFHRAQGYGAPRRYDGMQGNRMPPSGISNQPPASSSSVNPLMADSHGPRNALLRMSPDMTPSAVLSSSSDSEHRTGRFSSATSSVCDRSRDDVTTLSTAKAEIDDDASDQTPEKASALTTSASQGSVMLPTNENDDDVTLPLSFDRRANGERRSSRDEGGGGSGSSRYYGLNVKIKKKEANATATNGI